MSEYTDEQARAFASATYPGPDGTDLERAKRHLERLAKAGITVTFPEPRYSVFQSTTDRWYVHDRQRSTSLVDWLAAFTGPDAERHAHEHADRLNREAE